MSDIAIKRYVPADSQTWNHFVTSSANGTFLFFREYMDYHADRFTDHSLLIYLRGKLHAVFVACEEADCIYAHAGLTYGGLVVLPDARMEDVLSFFFHLLRYYNSRFRTLVYKCIPAPFARQPSNEDQYALYLLRATLSARNTASVFCRHAPLPYQQRRRKSVKSSSEFTWKISEAADAEEFWQQVLIPNLHDRYQATPVHTAAEMNRLMKHFPSNIRLFELRTDELVAGAVVYVMDHLVHTQYLSATPAGKEIGALDILVDQLITHTFAEREYVSLGTSNEKDGSLHSGLINWKEGFGTRTFVHDIYKVNLENYSLLASYE